nr:MAG TPA: hypothetical protein [Caudoviricetes sp.]
MRWTVGQLEAKVMKNIMKHSFRKGSYDYDKY